MNNSLEERLEVFLGPLKNWVIRIVPSSARPAVQRAVYLPQDAIEFLLGRRDDLVPPKGMIYSSHGDFKKGGEEFREHFVKFCQLRPSETILDVGSGMGRIAAALTKYLNGDARYEGFDVSPIGINWCKTRITSKFPNFTFKLVNVRNHRYNPYGAFEGSRFRFPYSNETFDFVFATSVFTHMLPQETENYLSEIARVLKDDGRCLVTFFVMTASAAVAETSRIRLHFRYPIDGCWTVDKKMPEIAVAYDEVLVRKLCQAHRLEIIEPIRYGSWSGRRAWSGKSDSVSYQDLVLAAKNV